MSLFEQTITGWNSRCYISGFVEISPPIIEKKNFEGFLSYMSFAAILGHVTNSICITFNSLVPKILHTKFG